MTKDRLIAKMVAVAMWSVATFNLVTGGAAGIKADMVKKEIQQLENQKIEEVDQNSINKIDNKIVKLNNEFTRLEQFVIPSVFSFIGTGTVGSAAIAYNEIKDNKQKKKQDIENTL